ncbi:hypothetical protein ES708_19870 [subsurface metagenome]
MPGTLRSNSVSWGRFSRKLLSFPSGTLKTSISSVTSLLSFVINSTSGAKKWMALVGVKAGQSGAGITGMSFSALYPVSSRSSLLATSSSLSPSLSLRPAGNWMTNDSRGALQFLFQN